MRAGCLLWFEYVAAGAIEYLLKAAEAHQCSPLVSLEFFSIDPSLEIKVKKMRNFVQKYVYDKEITWRWARLFDRNVFEEISTADCPRFVFACFIICANESQIQDSKKFLQFSRFIKDADPPSLTGENLGKVLKDLMIELRTEIAVSAGEKSDFQVIDAIKYNQLIQLRGQYLRLRELHLKCKVQK